MKNREVLLNERFRDKPECVINLPPRMLSARQAEAFIKLDRLAIVEMAGRDSVAAAIMAAKTERFSNLLPVYAYTGTEHGSWSSVLKAVSRLRRQLPGVHIHDLVVLGSPGFWHALNGRLLTELITRYGFYTPCVGCHLYLHAVRIPLAHTLRASIVAGERERHDGTVKVNQTEMALNGYQSLAGRFDVPLLFPLRHIDRGAEIEAILGFDWKQDAEQLGCVFSGNYKDAKNSVSITEENVSRYLDEFALPFAVRTIQTYMKGRVPNHLALAVDIFQSATDKRLS